MGCDFPIIFSQVQIEVLETNKMTVKWAKIRIVQSNNVKEVTLKSQTKIGESCPSLEAVVLPPDALTQICLVIFSHERQSSAASSMPPI